jgi:CTP:molybdopterin cytidylyltransferase MocA
MGSTKQLKLWKSADGHKPLICAAYDAIRSICDDMIVVLGHEAEAVATALGDRPFHRAMSSHDHPMFDSIRAGIYAARAIDPNATIVLHPGDHPQVAPATLRTLTDWSLQRPVTAIIPEHAGRGGHPVLIPPNIAALILTHDCPRGLAQFWLDHPELCHRIAVDDATMLHDVDTPAELNV